MDKGFVVSGKKTAALKSIYLRILFGNFFGWIVYVIGTFADSILGGMLLGEEALAAIEIVAPLGSLVFFVSYLVGVGSALLHAKYIGKNDFAAADRVYSTGIIFSFVAGLIMAVVFFLIKDAWLDLYGLEGQIRQYASDYYTPFAIYALIVPVGTQIYNSTVNDGDCIYSVIADFTQSILNVVLSLILVNYLDILGLSMATVIAAGISYAIPLLRLFSKANTLHFKFKFSFKDVLGSMKVGVSSYLNVLAVAVIDIVMNLYITETWGANYTAPYAIVNFSLEIASAVILVGQTLSTLMNFSVGEDNSIDIKALVAYTKKVALVVGGFFTLAFIGLTPVWPSLFGLESEEFVEAAYVASITIGLTYIPQTYLHLWTSYYISYEDMAPSLIGSFLNAFFLPLGCPIVISLLFGFDGFVAGFALANLLSTLGVLVFLLIRNKGKVLVVKETEKFMCSIDLAIDKESISKAIECLSQVLAENKVNSIVSNRAQVAIEESLNITLGKNKKKASARIVAGINDERLKIIVKDNGKIFDVINPDQKIENLSNFVFVMATSKANIATNYVSSNLNGNHYEFSLE